MTWFRVWQGINPKVRALNSALSGLGSTFGQGHVFLGKVLYSHSASLHPGVSMDTSELMLVGNSVTG